MAFRLDLIESAIHSAVFPLLHFDFSHLRVALAADGVIVFDKDWMMRGVSFVSSWALEVCPDDSEAEDPDYKVIDRLTRHIDKYRKRGIDIRIYCDEGVTPHACGTCLSCHRRFETLRTRELCLSLSIRTRRLIERNIFGLYAVH